RGCMVTYIAVPAAQHAVRPASCVCPVAAAPRLRSAPAGGRRPAYPRRRPVHHTERPLLPGGYGAAGPLGHGRGMDAAGPWDGSQRAVARLPDPAVAAVDRA